MATLLLKNTLIDENKGFSDILNTVDVHSEETVVTLHPQAVADRYRMISQVMNPESNNPAPKRKKTMHDLMKQSVFHGKGWMGSNFIA